MVDKRWFFIDIDAKTYKNFLTIHNFVLFCMSYTRTAIGYGAMQSVTQGLPSDPHRMLRGWMGAAMGLSS
jgi:hypothetical protein